MNTAAEVGVTELLVNFTARHRLHGTNLQLSFSCTYSECEMDVWLVLFMRETVKKKKKIHDLHLRESGDWRKSCWSLETSDGLIILELLNLQRAKTCLCLPATSYS